MESFKEFLQPEFIWALVGLCLLLLEFVTPGLIIFFFGVGAWIVALACLFWDISVNAQLIIFIISSIVLLAGFRKWLKGIFTGYVSSRQSSEQNLEDFIGRKVTVTETIRPPQAGTVEVNGVGWKAIADREIPAGQMVEVTGRDSLTLTVKPLG